jgi:squalene-hopene/tetraprenyl-beta-curcumene cyclase
MSCFEYLRSRFVRGAHQVLFLSSLIAAVGISSNLFADEPFTLQNVPEPAEIAKDEALAPKFSLELAARALDVEALHWQKTRQCAACHTLPPYLMARPLLSGVLPEPPEVRQFFEEIVAKRLEPEPSLPKDGIAAVTVQVAAALAFHDRATTGKLHPRTREELDRMWSLQRGDGSWEWPFRDTPPFKTDDHYGVTIAALATVMAPEDYAQTPQAQRGLAVIRQYLKSHPSWTLHQRTMLLWLNSRLEDTLTAEQRREWIDELKAAQRSDGGWSMATLTENSREPDRQTDAARVARSQPGHGESFLIYAGRDEIYRSSLDSDGYATGFALFVLRQVGEPAAAPELRRGVAWLKSNQRISGRWFTPSQGWHTENRITNVGNAFAVLALHACGEVK